MHKLKFASLLFSILAAGCGARGTAFTSASKSSAANKDKEKVSVGNDEPSDASGSETVAGAGDGANKTEGGGTSIGSNGSGSDNIVVSNGPATAGSGSGSDDAISVGDAQKTTLSYTIPSMVTAFYKKYQGTTNYYGKVEGNGPGAGNFYQIVCPSGSPSASGTATIHFMILVGSTWTKFSLGDTVPLDPKQPIYAKIEFDTHKSSGGDDHHFTEDKDVDIRAYFGPHPQYSDVSIAISTPGSPGNWPVGIGRGKDATRHPPTPDNTYRAPQPACN